jgi:NADPH2:quinone reductase
MAYMNDADAYAVAAEAVLTAIAGDVLRVAGKAYRLSEAAQAHVELESGRTSGALYLTV